jgi:hypothetical protein
MRSARYKCLMTVMSSDVSFFLPTGNTKLIHLMLIYNEIGKSCMTVAVKLVQRRKMQRVI